MPELTGTLAAGARVLDLGCVTGHAVTVAARAFPASRFVGVDVDERAIATADAERVRCGLDNAEFALSGAAAPPADPTSSWRSTRCATSARRPRCCGDVGRRGGPPDAHRRWARLVEVLASPRPKNGVYACRA
ncbi:methyltransferase domain-containing protein [Actinokineospora sp.]|uniref:methyltransferase domain-containing protein n=1 Tax=Actinokineospora sp. TaxID=1872133 RepID=UPI0040384339